MQHPTSDLTALERWLLLVQVAAGLALTVGGYLVLKLRHGWRPPRRSRS